MNKQAFTLIELLVVVLIIGILSAVALPQYQKAVEKSKATQALTLLKSLHQAQEAYFLANGTYPTTFDELDIEVPWSGTEQWYNGSSATDSRSNTDWSVQIYKGVGAGILIGRLSGVYKGAGFAIYLADSDKPTNTIICMERKSGGVVFEKEEGAYCHQLFAGVKFDADAHSNFIIP